MLRMGENVDVLFGGLAGRISGTLISVRGVQYVLTGARNLPWDRTPEYTVYAGSGEWKKGVIRNGS